MNRSNPVIDKVADLYDLIDQEIRSHPEEAGTCYACGACCDFERYGHRLFVTSIEMTYFSKQIGPENLKSMTEGACPYRINNRCSVHSHRFAGCRIFCCRGEERFQHELSERVQQKLKALCEKLDVPYRYADLKQALNTEIEVNDST